MLSLIFNYVGAIEQRHHEQTSIYNLEDYEEELTYYHQSLGKMEYFDDIILSSDDDNYTEGKGQYDIGDHLSIHCIVDSTEDHFGGFLHEKRSSDLEENEKE